jgi:hypothetical protein
MLLNRNLRNWYLSANQGLVSGFLFSVAVPVFTNNKTNLHNISDILLKVVLNSNKNNRQNSIFQSNKKSMDAILFSKALYYCNNICY